MALWLDLEVTDFSHLQGSDFGLNLLAFATRDRRPLQGDEIQFFAGGDPINQTVRTDKNGRAQKKEAVIEIEPGAKKILIEAQIVGTDKRIKKPTPVPWPEKGTKESKEAPTDLFVTLSGKRGKQSLTISVSTVDGSPIIGFVGTIIDGGKKKSFKIEENGTASYDVNFTEKSRVFEVRAGNTEKLIWKARLLGPERKA